MLSDVTMLIPTYDRQLLLAKIVDYYAHTGMRIVIADGTPTPWPAYNTGQLDGNITYLHLPSREDSNEHSLENMLFRFKTLAEHIHTPFAVMRSDRRHTLTEGIVSCRNFLLQHDDFASAQGVTYDFEHDRTLRPSYLMYHFLKVAETDNCYERVKKTCMFFTPTWYSVHRSEVLASTLLNIPLNDNILTPEMVQIITTMYYGKHKALFVPYCICQNAKTSHQRDYAEQHRYLFNNIKFLSFGGFKS